MKIQSYLHRPSPFLRRLLGRNVEPDSVDESELPEGILMVLGDKPQQALAAALRCRPLIYDQIALLMGVSRDRVRQLEISAANNLRRANRFRQLCRFMPGWQNALRVPPADMMSLLPGESIPPELMKKHTWRYHQNARQAFEHTLARWERLGGIYSHPSDEGPVERRVRLERKKHFEAIFGLKCDALDWKKNRRFSRNFQLCDMFLAVKGKPACYGCPMNDITGAPKCQRAPLAEALRTSRLGTKDKAFQTAAGSMAAFMRNVWTRTNGLKKKLKLSNPVQA